MKEDGRDDSGTASLEVGDRWRSRRRRGSVFSFFFSSLANGDRVSASFVLVLLFLCGPIIDGRREERVM